MNNKDALRDEILLWLLKWAHVNYVAEGEAPILAQRLRAEGEKAVDKDVLCTCNHPKGVHVGGYDACPFCACKQFQERVPRPTHTWEPVTGDWVYWQRNPDRIGKLLSIDPMPNVANPYTIGMVDNLDSKMCIRRSDILGPADPPVERPKCERCKDSGTVDMDAGILGINPVPCPSCKEPKRPKLPPGWTYEPEKRMVNPHRDRWVPKIHELRDELRVADIWCPMEGRPIETEECQNSPRWIVHPPSHEAAKGIATIRVYVRNDPKDGHYYVRQEVKQANGCSSDTCIAIFYCSCADANIKAQELCDRLNGVPDERVEYPQDLIKCVQAVAALQNELSVSCRATADHVRKLAQRDAQIEALKGQRDGLKAEL